MSKTKDLEFSNATCTECLPCAGSTEEWGWQMSARTRCAGQPEISQSLIAEIKGFLSRGQC